MIKLQVISTQKINPKSEYRITKQIRKYNFKNNKNVILGNSLILILSHPSAEGQVWVRVETDDNNIEHQFLVVKPDLSHPKLKIFLQAQKQHSG